MQWYDRMFEALDYIEDNLHATVSIDEAARIAMTTPYQFQRLFSYLVGMPLAAYLRQRLLSQAALDLQSGEKVLEVALRYGYDSPTAFNRAFRTVHGITPSQARKPGVVLRAFPRISFQRALEGVSGMEYRIEEHGPIRIVGVREPLSGDIAEAFERVPKFWAESASSGVLAQLVPLMDVEPRGMLGVSTCCGAGEQNYYYIGVATEGPADEDLFELTIPQGLWAIFPGKGDGASLQELQKRIFSQWLPSSGYEWAQMPDIEVYMSDNPLDMAYEVWLPITKK